jgi:hypothetical protein
MPVGVQSRNLSGPWSTTRTRVPARGNLNIPHDAASSFAESLIRTVSLAFLYNLLITIVLPHILRKDSLAEYE